MERKDSLSLLWETSGFPGASDGKESACRAGDPGLIPGLGRSTVSPSMSHEVMGLDAMILVF